MKKNKKEKRFRKSYQRKIKKPFYKKKFFISLIIAFIFLSVIFSLLIFSNFFSIKKIEIYGNEKIKSEDLINFIENKAIKSLLFLKSKSIFLFTPNSVAPELVNQFPNLFEFRLSRKYPDTIKLEVKERKPIGIWCEEQCFFFDKTGKIFEKTNIKNGLIVETENRSFDLGEPIFSLKEIESIVMIWKNLKNDIGLKKFYISGLRINVLTKENWLIYFTLEEDVNFQITKLYLTLKEKITLEERMKLDYIDLRFDKRIYFKYRDNELINIVN